MLATRVLLVDDDMELSEMLGEYLEQEGFQVDAVGDGEAAVSAATQNGRYDLVVLDVMLPKLSGVDALREIRAQSQIPILMLTARGSQIDRIVGLELGADDYVPKPCAPRELAARIRAILRRTSGDARPGDDVIVGELVLSPARRTVQWDGQRVDLTSTEFRLLEILARNAGKVVEKNALSEHALGRPLARFDRSIDVHVSSLRRKLPSDVRERSLIQTVRGVGYIWVLE